MSPDFASTVRPPRPCDRLNECEMTYGSIGQLAWTRRRIVGARVAAREERREAPPFCYRDGRTAI